VRQGKSLKDRTVYLTAAAAQAVADYLRVRGMGPTDHVFLYRNQPLSKDLIPGRLKAVGEQVGVKVYVHRLRHTCATQLLNAGCRITSIQKFLGHKKLNSTMIYARVHDQTVAGDYYAAMSSVEKRLALIEQIEKPNEALTGSERSQILALARQLTEPELSLESRLELATQIRLVLMGNGMDFEMIPASCLERPQSDHPPPVVIQ